MKESTIKYFFDTDCVSSFIWVNRLDIVYQVIDQTIVLPQSVLNEIKRVHHLFDTILDDINNRKILVMDFSSDSEEAKLFNQFTLFPTKGFRIIGDGEAACLAFAITHHGIISSNNLKDVQKYCKEYNLLLVTSSDILYKAYINHYISLQEANSIWTAMIQKKRRLPYNTFDEYLLNIDHLLNKEFIELK